MRFRSAFGLFFWAGALVSACANFSGWVRCYTYPPDFRYITRDRLRSSMWQLALHVREIDRIMRAPETLEQHRASLVEHLRAMAQAADMLDSTGWPSNHPLIDMNLGTLRRDIALALRAIQSDPPNYVVAASLTGACVYCHVRR